MKNQSSAARKRDIVELATIPPPPGESDAYNAPTRVSPLAENVYQSLLQQYEDSAVRAIPREIVESSRHEAEEPSLDASSVGLSEAEELGPEVRLTIPQLTPEVIISEELPTMIVTPELVTPSPHALNTEGETQARSSRGLQLAIAASFLVTIVNVVAWFLRTH